MINANLDLGGGTDSVALNVFGATVNLTLTDVETVTSAGGASAVNLTNAANGLDIDLGTGFQTLNLASTGNVVTVRNVETLNAFGSANDTVTFFKEASIVNQTINLGFGTNVLNLAGNDGNFSMFLSGGSDFTVNGQTSAMNENVNVLNLQGGTVFDLGAGANDVVSFANVNNNPGFNSASVRNVEQVFGNLGTSDTITVLGNAANTTVVTGGGGPDTITLSNDVDHVRFISTGDSSYDLPFAGQRDMVNNFNADQDKFVFDHIVGAIPANFGFQLVNFGGQDIILVDIDGGGVTNPMAPGGYSGYEMAIGVPGLTGTLDHNDFIFLT